MIFHYSIPDGSGDTLTAMIQAKNRAEADSLVRSLIVRAEKSGGRRFPFRDAEITDVSSKTILAAEVYDHELGEARFL